jgi:hypothetical protein
MLRSSQAGLRLPSYSCHRLLTPHRAASNKENCDERTLEFRGWGKSLSAGRLFTLPLVSVGAWAGAMLATLVTLAGVGGATAGDTGVQVFRAMVSSRVVTIAPAFLGQTIGRGECTDFVDLVLAHAIAQPGNNYVWGTPTGGQIQQGDIIQFWNAQFTGPNGASWGTTDKHTAIVIGVSGTRVTLIHQNFPTKVVTQGDYDLGWPHTGTYQVYRPVSK